MNMSSSESLSQTSLEKLPNELKCRIARFLHPLDAGRAEQSILGMPAVVALSPTRFIDQGIPCDTSESGEPIRAMSIYIPQRVGVETHSVQLNFSWVAGNQIGRIFVVQENLHQDQPPDSSDPFDGGILVCETEDVPQDLENDGIDRPRGREHVFRVIESFAQGSLLWHPSSNCHRYSVWYKVGRKGGFLASLSLTTYIFDDANLTYSKTFQQLAEQEVLYSTFPWPFLLNEDQAQAFRFFHQKIVEACKQFFQAQLPQSSSANMDVSVDSLFRLFQMEVNEASVNAVRDISEHELLLLEDDAMTTVFSPRGLEIHHDELQFPEEEEE